MAGKKSFISHIFEAFFHIFAPVFRKLRKLDPGKWGGELSQAQKVAVANAIQDQYFNGEDELKDIYDKYKEDVNPFQRGYLAEYIASSVRTGTSFPFLVEARLIYLGDLIDDTGDVIKRKKTEPNWSDNPVKHIVQKSMCLVYAVVFTNALILVLGSFIGSFMNLDIATGLFNIVQAGTMVWAVVAYISFVRWYGTYGLAIPFPGLEHKEGLLDALTFGGMIGIFFALLAKYLNETPIIGDWPVIASIDYNLTLYDVPLIGGQGEGLAALLPDILGFSGGLVGGISSAIISGVGSEWESLVGVASLSNIISGGAQIWLIILFIPAAILAGIFVVLTIIHLLPFGEGGPAFSNRFTKFLLKALGVLVFLGPALWALIQVLIFAAEFTGWGVTGSANFLGDIAAGIGGVTAPAIVELILNWIPVLGYNGVLGVLGQIPVFGPLFDLIGSANMFFGMGHLVGQSPLYLNLFYLGIAGIVNIFISSVEIREDSDYQHIMARIHLVFGSAAWCIAYFAQLGAIWFNQNTGAVFYATILVAVLAVLMRFSADSLHTAHEWSAASRMSPGSPHPQGSSGTTATPVQHRLETTPSFLKVWDSVFERLTTKRDVGAFESAHYRYSWAGFAILIGLIALISGIGIGLGAAYIPLLPIAYAAVLYLIHVWYYGDPLMETYGPSARDIESVDRAADYIATYVVSEGSAWHLFLKSLNRSFWFAVIVFMLLTHTLLYTGIAAEQFPPGHGKGIAKTLGGVGGALIGDCALTIENIEEWEQERQEVGLTSSLSESPVIGCAWDLTAAVRQFLSLFQFIDTLNLIIQYYVNQALASEQTAYMECTAQAGGPGSAFSGEGQCDYFQCLEDKGIEGYQEPPAFCDIQENGNGGGNGGSQSGGG